jgi:hypothetical protein
MSGLLLAHQAGPVGAIIVLLIWAASEADEWHGQVRYLRH